MVRGSLGKRADKRLVRTESGSTIGIVVYVVQGGHFTLQTLNNSGLSRHWVEQGLERKSASKSGNKRSRRVHFGVSWLGYEDICEVGFKSFLGLYVI